MKASVFVLLSVFILSGCSSLMEKFLEKPHVKLQQAYFQEADFSSATLVFVVAVENPNSLDLNLEELTYDVQIQKQDLAKTSLNQKVHIPAKKVTLVELPLSFRYAKILRGLGDLLAGKDVSYQITGSAKVSGFTVPFSESGQVNLRDLGKKQ